MALKFYKYHGSGNDFILIDDRSGNTFSDEASAKEKVALLCHRHFGIGADGLILLKPSQAHDFLMSYYNADGLPGSMCGNGGRCIVAFAKKLGITGNDTLFEAVDGTHRARILAGDDKQSVVSIQLQNVEVPPTGNDHLIINTGSPHLIIFSDRVGELHVENEGRAIRYSTAYTASGVNVNFVEQIADDTLFVRTYERGVEQETLSCGTGVTAACLGAWIQQIYTPGNLYKIRTLGGLLKVSFSPPANDKNIFTDIWLTGPANLVFEGEYTFD